MRNESKKLLKYMVDMKAVDGIGKRHFFEGNHNAISKSYEKSQPTLCETTYFLPHTISFHLLILLNTNVSYFTFLLNLHKVSYVRLRHFISYLCSPGGPAMQICMEGPFKIAVFSPSGLLIEISLFQLKD